MITQRIEILLNQILTDTIANGDDRKMEKVQIMLRQAAIDLGNERFKARQKTFQILKTGGRYEN